MSKLSSKTNYEYRNNKFFQNNTLANSITYHGLGNEIFLTYQLNKTLNIVYFNIL